MRIPRQAVRGGVSALAFMAITACSGTGGLGSILGSVLGQGQSNQLSGTVRGVDTRSRQIGIQQSNGQTIAVRYDDNTQVVYNDQRYPVTSLENGDQVTARIQDGGNGSYYADVIQVNQSVSSSSSANVQLLQGTVRQVDQASGLFVLDATNGARLTVQLPNNLTRADYDRFRSLRSGDYVRLYGVYLSNSRVELRQFN